MPVKELRVDLSKGNGASIDVVGRRDILSRSVEGNWATTFKGRGLEFTGYRQYSFSDDASLIDWKASLRSKETLIREYEEFKNFKVLFVLDTSDNMLFTSMSEKFKVEFAAEIIYILSQAAMKAGDAIGLSIFNQGIIKTLEPAFGSGMRALFERELLNKENYGGARDFKKSLLQINSILSEPTIIILFSDFVGLPDEWERYITLLSSQHQVFGMMVLDDRDRELPSGSGQFFLKDSITGESMYVDNRHFAKKYKDFNDKHIKYVRNVFSKVMSDCLVLENGKDPTKALQKFFNRQKHLLG